MDPTLYIIEISNLTKTFNHRAPRPAIDGMSLAVSPGEVVGLVGPNGAGKAAL